MIARLIDACLDNRWLVIILLAGFVVLGVWVTLQIPIDAFPDLTNNQVVVMTDCPGMPPTEVEQLVTFPIESAVMGLPHTEGTRSISKLGVSMVTIIFDDSVNTYFVRQIVN
jgi:cobalt-zinc-cadmium resistance protein CzcA